MAIPDNKEKVAVTLERKTMDKVRAICTTERRTVSNALQVLLEQALQFREKFKYAPPWAQNIVGRQVVFEYLLPANPNGDENMEPLFPSDAEREAYYQEIAMNEASGTILPTSTQVGRVVEVFPYQNQMLFLIDAPVLNHLGQEIGDRRKLLSVSMYCILKIIGLQEQPDIILRNVSTTPVSSHEQEATK